jgi:hypothetical protein
MDLGDDSYRYYRFLHYTKNEFNYFFRKISEIYSHIYFHIYVFTKSFVKSWHSFVVYRKDKQIHREKASFSHSFCLVHTGHSKNWVSIKRLHGHIGCEDIYKIFFFINC